LKVTHRISLSVDKPIKKQLDRLGVDVQLGFESFEIEEDTQLWSTLEPFIQKWDAVDVVSSKFTRAEINLAKYLRMCASWHWGYPQPDNDFGYLEQCFDLSDYSAQSGIGKVQKAPLRMKGEPRWGKKHILQLNWLFDIFFVQPQVWQDVFKPFGVACSPVVDHATGHELKTVVQLEPQDAISLNVDGLPHEQCLETNILKYPPVVKGFFPRPRKETDKHYVVSEEYFGSGHSASKAVIVSSDLHKALVAKKLKGANFVPSYPEG